MSTAGDRTEEATPRRKARALSQGFRTHSALAHSALTVLIAALLWWSLGALVRAFPAMLWDASAAGAIGPRASAQQLFMLSGRIIMGSGAPVLLAVTFFAACVAAVGATALCSPVVMSLVALVPRWARISPAAGITRLIGFENVSRALTGGSAVFLLTALLLPSFVHTVETLVVTDDITSQVVVSLHALHRVFVSSCAVLSGLAAVDVIVQRRRQAARLRMTPREVKEERAQHETRPEVKQRRRTIGVKRARGLRIAAVRRATAVIANPTHLAIALRYAPPEVDVPTVVARGADRMAQALKDIARIYAVPIIEAPELARDIYDGVDLDEPIPEECYEAVAAVFTWIMRVHGRLRRGDEDDA